MSNVLHKNQQYTEKLKYLQEAITKGIDSGDAQELDIAEIKKEARRRVRLI